MIAKNLAKTLKYSLTFAFSVDALSTALIMHANLLTTYEIPLSFSIHHKAVEESKKQ